MRSGLRIAPLAASLLWGALQLHAQDPALSPESDLVQVCQQFTAKKLDIWKTRLALTDWNITIILTKRDDLKPKTLGGIQWDKKKRTAVINVLHPSDYKLIYEAMLNDMEETVVHELIHLKLSALARSEASRTSEEEAVNGIAGALLKLDREK